MFANNVYATVWEVESVTEYVTKLRISTSNKNDDGEYETDFSGYVAVIGKQASEAKNLKERDRIQLISVGVTSYYDSKKKKSYQNLKVFRFNVAEPYSRSRKRR